MMFAEDIPASVMMRKRAGSAPVRAGVIAAPKSPPALARSATPNVIGMRNDAALNRTFAPRAPSSSSATPSKTPCAATLTVTV